MLLSSRQDRSRGVGVRVGLAFVVAGGVGLAAVSVGARADGRAKNRISYPVDAILEVRLAEAKRHEARAEWEQALAVYKDILEANATADPNEGNRVTPVAPGRHVGVSGWVRGRLRVLPKEARVVYRKTSDAWVTDRIQKALLTDDPAPQLDAIYEDCFLATDAPRALERAGDLDFAEGEIAAALDRYWRLLRQHRDPTGRENIVRAKAAVCCALIGRVDRLRKLLDEIRLFDPEARLDLDGRIVRGEDLLLQAIAVEAERARTGETAERGALGTAGGAVGRAIELGIHLWDQAAAGRVVPGRTPRNPQAFGLGPIGGARASNISPHYPVVAEGRLALAAADKLAIYDLASGKPLFRNGLDVRPTVHYEETNDRVIYGGTSHRGVFSAPFVQRVANEEYWRGIPIKVKIPVRKLVGFDGRTWKRLWDHSETLEETPLQVASFPTPPAARRGTLYASAFLVRGFVQSWVAAFDARTGEPKWMTWLCSGQVEQTMFGEHAIEPLCSPVVAGNDTVFHVTSFGAVVALEARTGRIKWMTEYEQIEVQAAQGYYPRERDIGWRNCPPVLVESDDGTGSVLVITPLDSNFYYGLDAERGAVIWKEHRDDLQYLVGAADGKVVLAGNRMVVARDARTGKRVWESDLKDLPYARTEVVSGRGVIAGRDAVIPLRHRLLSVEVETGSVSALSNTFNGHSNGGNVFAWGDQVLIAAPSRIHVYENRAATKGKSGKDGDERDQEKRKPSRRKF